MKMIILDENEIEMDRLNSLEYTGNYLEKNTNIPDIDENTKEILDKIDYSIGVYYPCENKNTFYISFLNKKLLDRIQLDITDVRGAYVSDVFLEYENTNILIEKMNEAYKTGKTQKFYFEYYDNNNVLRRRYDISFNKIGEFLYILGKNDADYFNLSKEQEQHFENDYNAIAILQDGYFVKVNKKYLELYKQDSYKDVIGQKLGYTGLDEDLVKEINKNFDKIIKGQMFSHIFPVEIKKDGKLIHCFNINGSYTVYNGKPAVMIVHHDLTKQELNKRKLRKKTEEAINLKNNLNFIQSVSKTGITYESKNKYIRSKQLYEILETEPTADDVNKYILWDFIVEEDRKIFKENYKKLNANKDSTDFIIRVKTAKGNIKYIHFFMRINTLDINGTKKENRVLYYQDVTTEQEYLKELKSALDESLKLKNNLEKIQKISKTSLCYINDKSNSEITWFSEGYSILELDPNEYIDDMSNYTIDEDKKIRLNAYSRCTPENPETSFIQRAITKKGNLIYVKTFVAYEFDDNGNKLSHIEFFQDITEEVEQENKLKEYLNETLKLQDNLERIQAVSKTAMGYIGKKEDQNWTSEVYEILEINPENYEEDKINIIEKYVIDEDKPILKEHINSLSPENPDTTFTQRIITEKGNLKYIRTVIHQNYDNNNKKTDSIYLNQDVTSEIEYQKQLETALNDKEMLLTEVHHRVKNNLQIILSLINLNKNFGTNQEKILDDTETRIYAMALIHEKIYGSVSLSEVNMKDYVEALVNSLFDTYLSNIKFHSDMEPISLSMDTSIPLGLIINELVINTITYAFPNDEEGNLYITFKKIDSHYVLTVKDDGVGLPDDVDLDSLDTLGLMVVQNLVLQLGGEISCIDCDGTGYKIEFEEQ